MRWWWLVPALALAGEGPRSVRVRFRYDPNRDRGTLFLEATGAVTWSRALVTETGCTLSTQAARPLRVDEATERIECAAGDCADWFWLERDGYGLALQTESACAVGDEVVHGGAPRGERARLDPELPVTVEFLDEPLASKK
jgi:hypothetical protein